MTLFNFLGTTNTSAKVYEGKLCTVKENKETKCLQIRIINHATITTSPYIKKLEFENSIVVKTENSVYFFDKVTSI